MGLDVTAYRKLTKVENPTVEQRNGEEFETHFVAHAVDWTEKNWPGRAKGVVEGTVYTFAETFDFCAGSYGGYNTWRDQLAKFAGYPLTEHPDNDRGPSHAAACWKGATGPFSELIDFADNEGVIGAEIAAKLAKDFASKTDQEVLEFSERETGDHWFAEQYRRWASAFTMAADGGAVCFH